MPVVLRGVTHPILILVPHFDLTPFIRVITNTTIHPIFAVRSIFGTDRAIFSPRKTEEYLVGHSSIEADVCDVASIVDERKIW